MEKFEKKKLKIIFSKNFAQNGYISQKKVKGIPLFFDRFWWGKKYREFPCILTPMIFLPTFFFQAHLASPPPQTPTAHPITHTLPNPKLPNLPNPIQPPGSTNTQSYKYYSTEQLAMVIVILFTKTSERIVLYNR